MNILGKATLYTKKIQGSKGEFAVYTAVISNKLQNGEYVHKYVRVRFASSLDLSDLSPDIRYQMNVTDGWLSVERWSDAQGNSHDELLLFVNDCEIEEAEVKAQPKTTKKTVKKVTK